MKRSFIAGSGLMCALGNHVADCVNALFANTVAPTRYTNDTLDMPIDMPWYGIQSGRNLDDPCRFYTLLNQTVSEALQQAALDDNAQKNMGIFIGSSSFEVGPSELLYQQNLLTEGPDHAMPMPLESLGNIAKQLGDTFQISGPDFVYGTACSASSNALLGAQRLIKTGVIEHALVIGVELHNLTTLSGFNSLQLVANDAVKPFSKDRSGLILGEACAAVVLSAEGAQSKTNTEHASHLYIAGGASHCDTNNITGTNTDGVAIAKVISEAIRNANLAVDNISTIKAHATASYANDTAEANGLHALFKTMPPVFAMKPFVGHTLGACGIVELVLLDACLKQKRIPATPNAQPSDAALNINVVDNELRVDKNAHFLMNCFGFGGNNTVFVASHE